MFISGQSANYLSVANTVTNLTSFSIFIFADFTYRNTNQPHQSACFFNYEYSDSTK